MKLYALCIVVGLSLTSLVSLQSMNAYPSCYQLIPIEEDWCEARHYCKNGTWVGENGNFTWIRKTKSNKWGHGQPVLSSYGYCIPYDSMKGYCRHEPEVASLKQGQDAAITESPNESNGSKICRFISMCMVCVLIVIVLLIIVATIRVNRFPGEDADHQMNKLHLVHEIVTFLLGIVFFCNGGWMLLFETVGIVRALAMCASLFLIWRKAKQLCKVKRTEAFLKVSSLRSKTRTDLKNVIDICAICYQDLQTALVKETVCKHLFHESCLCKWASLSDKCPMCHRNAFAS